MFMDPRSASLAAKHRQRGPSVLERLRAEEEAAAEKATAARATKRLKTVATACESSGGMAIKTGMVLARSQLHESNDVNAKLEDKVHTQHDKLVQMSKTVSQLQDVQQRLDAKIADSERRARENEALRAAEKSDLEEVSEGGRREGWREWGWN